MIEGYGEDSDTSQTLNIGAEAHRGFEQLSIGLQKAPIG
jgi:hypothetical protein